MGNKMAKNKTSVNSIDSAFSSSSSSNSSTTVDTTPDVPSTENRLPTYNPPISFPSDSDQCSCCDPECNPSAPSDSDVLEMQGPKFSQKLKARGINRLKMGHSILARLHSPEHKWNIFVRKYAHGSVFLALCLDDGPVPVVVPFSLDLLDYRNGKLVETLKYCNTWRGTKESTKFNEIGKATYAEFGPQLKLDDLETKHVYDPENDCLSFQCDWEIQLAETKAALQMGGKLKQSMEAEGVSKMAVGTSHRKMLLSAQHKWSVYLRKVTSESVAFAVSIDEGPTPIIADYAVQLFHHETGELVEKKSYRATWNQLNQGVGPTLDLAELTKLQVYNKAKDKLSFRCDWEILKKKRVTTLWKNIRNALGGTTTDAKGNLSPVYTTSGFEWATDEIVDMIVQYAMVFESGNDFRLSLHVPNLANMAIEEAITMFLATTKHKWLFYIKKVSNDKACLALSVDDGFVPVTCLHQYLLYVNEQQKWDTRFRNLWTQTNTNFGPTMLLSEFQKHCGRLHDIKIECHWSIEDKTTQEGPRYSELVTAEKLSTIAMSTFIIQEVKTLSHTWNVYLYKPNSDSVTIAFSLSGGSQPVTSHSTFSLLHHEEGYDTTVAERRFSNVMKIGCGYGPTFTLSELTQIEAYHPSTDRISFRCEWYIG